MKPTVSNIKPALTSEQTVSIETFVVLVKSGIELWTKAGEMLVKLVEQNPNIYSEIIAKSPTITFEMLLAFERMGRKQIYPPLLMDNSPAAKMLLELPYDMQERFSKEQVELVVSEDGDTEKRYLKELNAFEAKQMFDSDGIRPVEKQKEYLKTHFRAGRKKATQNRAKCLGIFSIKISPSGAVVVERASTNTTAQSVYLFEKDGTQQGVIMLYKR